MADNTKTVNNEHSRRITSIDALRAFALFGILLVHLCSGMGSGFIETDPTIVDNVLKYATILLFRGKCALIFNILFGVSFYIILRKPSYSSSKFVWRCFLLFLIGLFNQFFYNSDALMWYGLCGMVLVLFRHVKIRNLLIIVLAFYMLSFIIEPFQLGDRISVLVPSSTRYANGTSLSEFIRQYPLGVFVYFKGILNTGIFRTIANFLIGYIIGRVGFVERWDELIAKRYVIYSFCSYFILFIPCVYISFINKQLVSREFVAIVETITNLAGASFYTFILVYFYNHSQFLHSIFSWFEPYGKCGLTNYTMQGIIGNIVFFHFGLSFISLHFLYICIVGLLFYVLQNIFCKYWLSIFRNGPMEYLWRCATERKILEIKK